MELWHLHLGHMNNQSTRFVVRKFNLPIYNLTLSLCHSCVMGKLHCVPSPSRDMDATTSSLQIVYVDLWEPAPMSSIYEYHYFIYLVDGFTKFIWFFPLSQKSDALSMFQTFRTVVEKETGYQICSLQTNNSGEFTKFCPFL